jgi:Putative metal-binding motif
MKKPYGLFAVIGGMLIILPLLQAQETLSARRLHNVQTNDTRLAERDPHSSTLRAPQRTSLSLDRTQDYVSQSLPAPHPMAAVPDGELVTYRAFDGTLYSLQQYTGKYTAILIKPEDVHIYTLAQLRELLDQCDLLYANYKELIPAEPVGQGVITIAFVDLQDRNPDAHIAGLGRLGVKGIEVDFSKIQALGASLYGVIVHEMAHNFDQYSPAIMVGSDPVHAWTTFWESYIAFYSSGAINPDAAFAEFIDNTLNLYLKDPAATWVACVKDDACRPTFFSNALQASALLRAVELFGPAMVTPWLKRVDEASRSLDFSRMSPNDKNNLLVETLSQAVNANLTCFFDYLRWPVSDRTRAKLQRQYQDSTVCQDRDNDGYSPLQGDCDDSNPRVVPGATEVANGVDDDCNLIIDDVLVSEVGDFPNTASSAFHLPPSCRVMGTISSATDFDHFQINFPTESTVAFSARSIGGFIGWVYYYNDSQNAFSYLNGESGRQPFTVPAGPWNFAIAVTAPANFGHYPTGLGQYEVRVRTLDAETELPVVPPARAKHFNEYILTAPPTPATLSSRSGVVARFWVSSIGWVGSIPASRSNETAFEWIAPVGTVPGMIWYRVQYYEGSLPLTGVTAPAPIDLTYDPVSGPVISSAAFDGRKTVTISGARFGNAPQVIINYVDRSSTIKVASEGSITLTSKAKKLGLKAGDNTVQVINASGVASPLFVLRL